MMATFAELVGAPLPDNAAEDSWSVLPAIVGGASREPERLAQMKAWLAEVRVTGLRFVVPMTFD